ncbi:MAG: hypothetical protein HYS40_08300 [Gemmatimonadetes bacterium]|nr:hypothetical protein [Gemmatimonadota bacterium]
MGPSRWLVGLAMFWGLSAGFPPGARGQFVPPEPPCRLKPRNYLVQSATVYLHLAGEPRYQDQRQKNLRETRRVLVQALTTDQQGQNPAAWYYLGRYFVEVDDAAGGDSAFARAEALAPECREDIGGHRHRLWRGVLNNGFRSWQEGKEDSAIGFFRGAFALVPGNPRSLFPLGAIYLNRQEIDSAVAYLQRGAELAAGDTALARERRSALNSIGQVYLGRALADSSVQQWPRTRTFRDSVERAITVDSMILSRMQADAASRRARGASLAPASQRGFSRDSAGRAQALARGRTTRAEVAERVARDSTTAHAELEPAIGAYRRFVVTYPGDAGAISKLASLYSVSGREIEASAVFDSLFAASPQIDATVLLEAGHRFVQGNLLAAATRALALGLAKSPYHRTGLFDFAAVSIALRDTAKSLATAQRLVALDPLNRSSLRLVAAAWELTGRQDSLRKYRSLADSGLAVEIAAIGLTADSTGFTLTVAALNLRPITSQPFQLTFEFLDPEGAIQESRRVDIPALATGTSHQFDIRVAAHSVLGWRYRAP